ncbi:MAG: putative rane protein [Chlorobi bacterium]|nr:putative rane protein [Chlorobiota bacterium]
MIADILRPLARVVAAAVAAGCIACAGTGRSEVTPVRDARQALLVTTDGWNATTGVMRRFIREKPGGAWRQVGDSMPVVVGRNGLAWGRGINPAPGAGPRKHEGDGRAPAGIFRLRSAFGYAPRSAADGIRLPYTELTASIECVDDSASRSYNRITDAGSVAKDWSSSEKMARAGVFYRWGITVDHNTDPAVPGGGSCIFIHIWGGPSVATSGCTALDSANVVSLLGWLDPTLSPVLVQLPADELPALRTVWDLP